VSARKYSSKGRRAISPEANNPMTNIAENVIVLRRDRIPPRLPIGFSIGRAVNR
jgi:hypothetical protein